MRTVAPTSPPYGRGWGALRAMLVAGGAVLALTLAAVAVGLAEPEDVVAEHARPRGEGVSLKRRVTGSWTLTERQPVGLHSQVFGAGEWAVTAEVSTAFSLLPTFSAARGRWSLLSDSQGVHRAMRERQAALVVAFEQVMRSHANARSAGCLADCAPLVTSPERGPPVPG